MANERTSMEGSSSVDWSFPTSQTYLPPRSPLYGSGGLDNNNLFSNWSKLPPPGAGNRRHHQRTTSTSFLPQTPAWIDDLLNDTDTSAVPPVRSGHRRSSSDSIAFLEAPMQHVRIDDIAEEEDLDSFGMWGDLSRGSRDFSKLNHQYSIPSIHGNVPSQKHCTIASPFERRRPAEASSAPSDNDSANVSCLDDKETKARGQFKNYNEAQSSLKAEQTGQSTGKGEGVSTTDGTLDPKRAKRILANRQSAQRSRVRKLQYIGELERTVNALQEEVSALSPQVTCVDRHRIILNVENSAMKQRIAALAQEKLFKDAHNEALKTEVHRLRQLYQQQQQKQAQQVVSRHISQQPLSVPSPQLEIKDSDQSEVTKYVEDVLREDEDFVRNHAPQRSPAMKPIGPSSCSTGEKGKGIHSQALPAMAQVSSDYRIQNP